MVKVPCGREWDCTHRFFAPDCVEERPVFCAEGSLCGNCTALRGLIAAQLELWAVIEDGVCIQECHYGNATALHLEMIGWARRARTAVAEFEKTGCAALAAARPAAVEEK
jgi:hypothetical protein